MLNIRYRKSIITKNNYRNCIKLQYLEVRDLLIFKNSRDGSTYQPYSNLYINIYVALLRYIKVFVYTILVSYRFSDYSLH